MEPLRGRPCVLSSVKPSLKSSHVMRNGSCLPSMHRLTSPRARVPRQRLRFSIIRHACHTSACAPADGPQEVPGVPTESARRSGERRRSVRGVTSRADVAPGRSGSRRTSMNVADPKKRRLQRGKVRWTRPSVYRDNRPAASRTGAILESVSRADLAFALRKAFQSPSARWCRRSVR